jgi:hypothetical protein
VLKSCDMLSSMRLQTGPVQTSVVGLLIFSAVIFNACAMLGSTPPSLAPELKVGSKCPVFWPPRAGEKFPDLHLVDSSGRAINLSNFEGKVILVEEIAMTCPACNAFCGANRSGSAGGFRGVAPQPGLPAFDDYLRQQGIDPNDPKLERVDLILYNSNLKAPSVEEVKDWCHHFGIREGGNHVVVLGDKSMVCQASYDLIPGFQLVDRSFKLCCDSTGHNPKADLWREFVPMLKRML